VELKSSDAQAATIVLNKTELGLVGNLLNELANGVRISDQDLQARRGQSRLDVRELLAEFSKIYRALPPEQK
jgi:hypothetical protein